MLTAALATLITNHLRLIWSPETIAAAYNLSTASIYNWLNRGWLPFKLTDLPNRNVRQHRVSENRGKFTSGTSIEQRPTTVNQRSAWICDCRFRTSLGSDNEWNHLIKMSS